MGGPVPHPAASCQFCRSCPSLQQSFCTVLVVHHTLPVFGGPLAGCRGSCEQRARRYRSAGACRRNFWLARAKGACSPPGQRPNGMAGRLPALALIVASLRFEVTRSFQSFIPTLARSCQDAGPERLHRPSLPAPLSAGRASGAGLGAGTAPAHGKASLPSSSRWQQGTWQHLGDSFPPVGLSCSSRCHSGDQDPPNAPRGKTHTARPACRGLVRRHSPLQNNLELPSFPAKALGRVFYSRSLGINLLFHNKLARDKCFGDVWPDLERGSPEPCLEPAMAGWGIPLAARIPRDLG